MRKKKYTVEIMPKYSTMAMLESLTPEERLELKQQCLWGRSCYIVDADLGDGIEGSYAEYIIDDLGRIKL